MTQSRSFGQGDSTRTLKAYFDLPFLLVLLLLVAIFSGWQTQSLMHSRLGAQPWLYDEFSSFLQNVVATNGIQISSSLRIRFFLAEFFALFGLSVFFSCSSNMFFHGLHINVRRVIALVLATLFVVCSVSATSLENKVWLASVPENFVAFKTPAFYLAIRAILTGLGAFGILFPFVSWGQNRANRLARCLLVVCSLGALMLVDWRVSKEQRTVANANLSPDSSHVVVLVVPDFSEKDMSDFLGLPEITAWRERMVGTLRVLPTSDAALSQFATLLTGELPSQHGIRTDWVEPELAKRVGEPFMQGVAAGGRSLFVSSVGSVQNTSAFFSPEIPGTRCSFEIEQIVDTQALDNFLLAHSLLPSSLTTQLFPEYKCGQKFESLAELHRGELKKMTELLKSPQQLAALFWVDPNAYVGLHSIATTEKMRPQGPWQSTTSNPFQQDLYWDSNQSAARARILAQVFTVYEEYLNLVGMNKNTRVIVTGLASRTAQPVSAVVFDPRADEDLKSLLARNVVVPQSSLAQLLGFAKNDEKSLQNDAVFESLRFPTSQSSAQSSELPADLSDDSLDHFALPLSPLFELRPDQTATTSNSTQNTIQKVTHVPLLPSRVVRLMTGYALRAAPCSLTNGKDQNQPLAVFWTPQKLETEGKSEDAKVFPPPNPNVNPNLTLVELQPPLDFATQATTREACDALAREKLRKVVTEDVDLLENQIAFLQMLKAKPK